MSTKAVPSPGGHTYTLKKADLPLAVVIRVQRLGAEKGLVNQEYTRFFPQVSELRGKKKKKRKRKKKIPDWIETQVNHVSLEIALLQTQRGRKGNWHSLFCCCACGPFPFFVHAGCPAGWGWEGAGKRACSRALSPPGLRFYTKEGQYIQASKEKKKKYVARSTSSKEPLIDSSYLLLSVQLLPPKTPIHLRNTF